MQKNATTFKLKLIGVGMLLMAIFITELLFYTWCRVQSVRMGYEITQAAERQRKLKALQNNYQIELAYLKSPKRISQKAREELGLVLPERKQMHVIP